MADRRVRPGKPSPCFEPSPLSDALLGIRHHLEIDRWFHGDRVFLEGERLVAARVREAGVSARRMGLLAHVLWEMCLDGALVRRMGLAPALDAIREGFASLEGQTKEWSTTITSQCGVVQTDAERALFSSRMQRLREALEEGSWIDGYQDGAGIALRTSGVRVRLRLPPLDDADLDRLGRALDALQHQADGTLDEILRVPIPTSNVT